MSGVSRLLQMSIKVSDIDLISTRVVGHAALTPSSSNNNTTAGRENIVKLSATKYCSFSFCSFSEIMQGEIVFPYWSRHAPSVYLFRNIGDLWATKMFDRLLSREPRTTQQNRPKRCRATRRPKDERTGHTRDHRAPDLTIRIAARVWDRLTESVEWGWHSRRHRIFFG